MISPSIILYSLCIVTSILMMLSTSSLFTAWLALELNTMAFIPLIVFQNEMKTGENSIKYFLSQTMGSIMILISTTMTDQLPFMAPLILICALSVKMAVAPFHAWLPSMISKMSWTNMFMLLVVQKINPLLIMCNIDMFNVVIFLSLMSMSVGSLTGVTQTQTRKLMVFSSINQMGWVLAASCINSTLCLIFFMLYSLLIWPVVNTLSLIKLEKLSQLVQMRHTSMKALLFLTLLSLGGLPPFTGFLPKWMVLSATHSPLMLLIMIFMSLVTLMFYLRMTLSTLVLSESNEMVTQGTKTPLHLILGTQLSLFMLIISFMV